MEERQRKQLIEMLPVWGFVLFYFIFQTIDWMEVTRFIWASLIGVMIFFVMAAKFREEYGDKIQTPKLNFFTALLTILFVLIFASGFLHWNRLVSYNLRNVLLFVSILVYFIILFRSIRVLKDYKTMVENKKS